MRLVCSNAACLWLFGVLAFGQSATSSASGKLIDVTGAGIWQAQIKLESDRGDQYSAQPNAEGEFSFSRLLPGEYVLTASSPGFHNFTVRGIKVIDGKTTTVPSLQLKIGYMGCDPDPVVEYVRFVEGEHRTGDLGGRIQLDQGPMKRETQGIAGAEVWLLCGRDVICGMTTSDQDGEFRFIGLKPGKVNLQVRRKGFYPRHEAGYRVEAGRESIYYPIYLEKCFRGNCNPSKRPKKPLAVCE